MTGWDLLVSRGDLTRTELRAAQAPEPAEGEALLAVERFSLTANNITYGAIGDMLGYWKFFPAPEGWGRIPVWGFATVVASKAADVPVGLRLFGYLPMSSHVAMRLVPAGGGFVDAAAHRADLPPTYNQYTVAPPEASDDHMALLRPLFFTSWLLNDLIETSDWAPASVVLTSASSKTALGLAWLLSRRGVKVVGLTSPGNRAFVESLGWYSRTVTYDEAASLDVEGPAVLVDFAGDRKLVGALHKALSGRLVHSAIVGVTHWEAGPGGMSAAIADPQPALFFAPDQIRKQSAEWGAGVLFDRIGGDMRAFVQEAGWLKLEHRQGGEALGAAYDDLVHGRVPPDAGLIITT